MKKQKEIDLPNKLVQQQSAVLKVNQTPKSNNCEKKDKNNLTPINNSPNIEKQSNKESKQIRKYRQIDQLNLRKIPSKLAVSYDEVDIQKLSIKKISNGHKKEKSNQLSFNKQSAKQLGFKDLIGSLLYCTNNQKQRINSSYYLTDTQLLLANNLIRINNIVKMKILINQKAQYQIKINYFANLNNDKNQLIYQLFLQNQSQFFALFSQILVLKLLHQGFVINQPISRNKQGQTNSQIHGYIYKKSQYLKNWEQREVTINKTGFTSFRQGKSTIHFQNTQEIWTRFHMIYGFLIIKIWNGIDKIQLGIPIMNFIQTYNQNNWIYSIYHHLLKPRK